MTFQEIVTEVAERLNLTSDTATERIARSVNERYRWLSASVGLHTTKRGTVSASTTVGNRNLTFTGTVKLYEVYDPTVNPVKVLEEKSFFEIRRADYAVDPARCYAIHTMGPTSVTIFLDSTPASIYTLTADCEVTTSDLSGTDVPNFTENFHDILIYGAMATELYKLEKYDLAREQTMMFENRLGQLRLFIATSAYNEMYPSKTEERWWRQP